MARIPILMPQLGESIAEATIVRVAVEEGGEVEVDSAIMEVETNKAMMEVMAQSAGKIEEIRAEVGQTYPVGAVLGYIDDGTESNGGDDRHEEARPQEREREREKSSRRELKVEPRVRGLPVPAHLGGASFLSPRMKARMQELGLHAADLAGVAGSGAGGRVTIDDLERYLTDLERNDMTPASSMRVAVADAMRRSWTRPLATVVLPVAMDRMLEHRRQQEPKPGPALYALRALAIALGESPAPAGRLVGGRVIHPRAIDIGFAVEANDGVLVPVIRDADGRKLADLVGQYNRLVELARDRKLPPAETGGSIATVTNYGVFGLTLATPIPLPEQTLLLGMGAGRVEPQWNKETKAFEPATMSNFTLSFDHRVLDGGAAGRLLQRVSDLLNDPDLL